VLRYSRETDITHATDSFSPPDAPLNLFDTLSQEIRDQIWGHCVASGKVFLSNRTDFNDIRFEDFDKYEKLHLSILGVSKDIRLQAAKVFFERNHFVFPATKISGLERLLMTGETEQHIFTGEEFNISKASLWRLAREHLRSVSVTFDLRSPDPTLDSVLFDAAVLRMPSRPSSMFRWSHLTEQEKVSRAHDHIGHETYNGVRRLLGLLLKDCAHLKLLELDFTNCYCRLGCCRYVSKVMRVIRTQQEWPKHLRVLGMKNQDERTLMEDALTEGLLFAAPETMVFEKYQAGPTRVMQYPFGGKTIWQYLREEDVEDDLESEEVMFEQ
jgi:hypothetical protein